jgi:hypothetical protein
VREDGDLHDYKKIGSDLWSKIFAGQGSLFRFASRPCEPVRRLHSCSVSALDTVFAAVAKILFTDFLTELLPSRSVLADDFSAPASSGASDLLRSSAACTLPILSF